MLREGRCVGWSGEHRPRMLSLNKGESPCTRFDPYISLFENILKAQWVFPGCAFSFSHGPSVIVGNVGTRGRAHKEARYEYAHHRAPTMH